MRSYILVPDKFACLVLALALGITSYQVLVPPITGLADNGDFAKMTMRAGLLPTVTEYDDLYWHHINSRYLVGQRMMPYTHIVSSQSLLIELSLVANRMLSEEGAFDIRALGAIHILFLLLAMCLILLAGRKLDPITRTLLAVLLALVFTDACYVLFFNSFYTETASLLFLGFTVGLTLLLAKEGPAVWLLAGWLLAVALLISAKPQNSPLGLFLALFCLCLARLSAARPWKKAALAAGVLICVFSLAYYLVTPRNLNDTALYNVVFFEILKYSPSPEQDLQALGLPGDLMRYANTHAFAKDSPVFKPEFRSVFYAQVGQGAIIRFYLTHPLRLYRLLERSARSAFIVRYPYLGNFEKATGLPSRSQSRAFTLWSSCKEKVLPASLWFVALFFGGNCVASLLVYGRSADPAKKTLAALLALLALMALAQFGIATVGDAPDIELSRHLFLFNALFDACLIMNTLWLVGALAGRVRSRTAAWARKPAAGQAAETTDPTALRTV